MDPLRVLVADDHPLYALALLALLSDEQVDVVARARNGAEAVALTRQLRPDVVIMDVHMPLVDGIEATRLIRTFAPRTRVIVLTSDDSAECRAGALAAGAVRCIVKTSDPQELIAAVNATGEVVPFPNARAATH